MCSDLPILPNKRMNRSDLALARFVTCVEFNPTSRPVILVVRQTSERYAWGRLL
jgi:hypothetical protein